AKVMVRSLTMLALCQVGALSLWFSAAAIVPSLAAEFAIQPEQLAGLTTATQLGFVLGALASAAIGLPDRYDPRTVFAVSALVAAFANTALLLAPPDSIAAITSRAVIGAALAGCYPPGMKIAVGWSIARRSLIVSLLVAALTMGTAAPHLLALIGGADWRPVVIATSVVGALSALGIFAVSLGPHHKTADRFNPGAIVYAWRNRAIRTAYFGYFGHMWELYGYWAWVATFAAIAATNAGHSDPVRFGSLIAFAAITLGALACIPVGWLAVSRGKAPVARAVLLASGSSAILAALTFSAPLPIFAAILIVWGIAVIPDSAQFSALVADAAPPDMAGSLLTLQNAIGFALSAVTVQLVPEVAAHAGWPMAMAILAIGPAAGALLVERSIARPPKRPLLPRSPRP
ncbi:MAG: MFS transporter, partial [Pseudomonadota bacterium]